MDSKEELLDLLDDKGNVIGIIARKEVEGKALLHKAVCVFVINSKNELLLNKRSKNKKIFPGLWGIGASGGVKSKENYEEAAKRELLEETGIDARIKFLFDFRYETKEDKYLGKVYLTKWDGKIILEKEEIDETMFGTVNYIKDMIKRRLLCPDTALIFEKYLQTQL
jgi:isopentenyldiphosphate isomerase